MVNKAKNKSTVLRRTFIFSENCYLASFIVPELSQPGKNKILSMIIFTGIVPVDCILSGE